MEAQTLSQMNIRLDGRLKTAGDAVLTEAGTNPTQLIRALWQKIAHGTADLRQVERVLGLRVQDESASENAATKLAAIRRGRTLFVEGLVKLGVDPTGAMPSSDVSDRDRYADALVERMQERGIW